jgi:GNAT superfamily N-acetyltransferase
MFSEYNYNNDDDDTPATTTATKTLCHTDDDDCTISAFMFAPSQLPYLATYIYPFWKKVFLPTPSSSSSSSCSTVAYNPYASWSPQDIVRHNMGCKDNTLCVQVLVCDIPVGFCTVLLLDQFDHTDKLSPFSQDIYRHSAVLYNFIIDAPFRQQGYGSRMLEAVLTHLSSTTAYQYLMLYVDKSNTGAKKMYQRTHFTCLGDNPNDHTQELYRRPLATFF